MHVAASRRCDFARRGWGVGIQIDLLPAASELNPLATHAPWGLMQRLSPLHECGGAEMPPYSWTRCDAPTERTRNRDAFKIRITLVQPILVPMCALQPNGNGCKTGEA
ncbi:MAG: hypothetical protein F9K27_12320 [Anaerolineae bacterium]|nr:MAG: hypothetical protein F9K27_12320 [Anaerolineae bacterium]